MKCIFNCPVVLNQVTKCSWSRIFRYLSDRKKFFEKAIISSANGGFEINLDSRKLRSRSGNILLLPTEGLAHAVATEWNMQNDTIKLDRMPLTALCFATADNMNKREKESFINSSLKYLSTDTVLCHAVEPAELASMVNEKWMPLIEWVQRHYSISIKPAVGFQLPQIPLETYTMLSRHLRHFNYWSVVGFETMSNVLKSVVISLAVMSRYLTIEEAVSLSRLEQEYQIAKWGNVAWYHDIELMDMRMKTAACSLFIQLCTEERNYLKNKRDFASY